MSRCPPELKSLLPAPPVGLYFNLGLDENWPSAYAKAGAVPHVYRQQTSWDTASVRPVPGSPYSVPLKKVPRSAPLLGKKLSVEDVHPNENVTKEKKKKEKDGFWGLFCSKKSKDLKGTPVKEQKNPSKELLQPPKTSKPAKLMKKPSKLKLLQDFTASSISIPLSSPKSSETESVYPKSSASSARTLVDSSDSGYSGSVMFPPTKPSTPWSIQADLPSDDMTPQHYRDQHVPIYFTLGPSWHEGKDFDLLPVDVSEQDYYEGIPVRRPARAVLPGPPPERPLPLLPEDVEAVPCRRRAVTLTSVSRLLVPIDECTDAELDGM